MSLPTRGGWPGRLRAALGGGPCVVCRSWQTQAVCAACGARFAAHPFTRCGRCGLERVGPRGERARGRGGEPLDGEACCAACRARAPAFVRAVIGVSYQFPWDGLLTRLKFHGALELAPALAELLGDAVLHDRAMDPAGGRPELVVPVPLSETRLRQRGYNQSWELARRVARRCATPARADVLTRVRDTRPQSELDRDERLVNVRGAFVVPSPPRGLRGATVALVDDVMTTGATLDAAADALLRAGVREVHVWVMARTPAPE